MRYWHSLRLVSLLGVIVVLLFVLLLAARTDSDDAPPVSANSNFNL